MAARQIDLDALRTFVFGLDLGSFAKAAIRVGRSRSAVSEQMSRLEDQVGKQLLRRHGRGLLPTEAGELLLSYGRRLLDLNDEAVAAIRGADLEGWVRLGLPQDFSELWLPQVLGRFARQHPRVRVEARVERSSEMSDRVDTGKLDLALIWGEMDGPRTHRLSRLPVRWIGPSNPDPVLTRRDPVPLVVFEPPCRFRSAGVEALDAAGVAWRIAFTSSSLAGLWAAVAAGIGITMRTPAGLPETVRAIEPEGAGLPSLPSIVLSMKCAAAEPTPAVALLTTILRETLAIALDSFEGHP